ncbi:MAG TPA: bifunctional 4-hydroxy-2-oxoglutarate aldolase/2-dehydro-3-deoxy-phosphogluconate aldolase [Aestuariivirgaceae bacterium]|jgi:2-dehydro-3-deoxyphosphogluconate aldolase/(4S)-4-hydroxy-2-oxoglutarate aldolase
MTGKQQDLEKLLKLSPIVAVLQIDEVASAVPLARALVKGGVRLIEVTLRTPSAAHAISAIMGDVEEAIVGGGTILSPRQFAEVQKLGCRFAVSPGSTPDLIEAASRASCPWLPGAATVSEMLRLLEHGFALQKFFPAEAAGGVAYLKSLATVLSALRFCPTGGIDESNAASYLRLPNVLCVGGSWIAPRDLVSSGRWDEISARAASAVQAHRG